MELKFKSTTMKNLGVKLLIAPNGIEMVSLYFSMPLTGLLIAPNGIEIIFPQFLCFPC